ncbi:hypothetical protein D030_2811B, partial [Vibrio parahaemolyticus AQ3810]
TNLGATTKR